MCEVMRSPTLEMSAHPLRLLRPSVTSSVTVVVVTSPPSAKRSNIVPSLDMFALDARRSEARRMRMMTAPAAPPPSMNRSSVESDSESESSSDNSGVLKRKGRLTMETVSMQGGCGRRTTTKTPIVLSVYCTPFDKYAVISQERVMMSKDCGYINLKNCCVRAMPSSRQQNPSSSKAALDRKCNTSPSDFSFSSSSSKAALDINCTSSTASTASSSSTSSFQITTCDGEKQPLVFHAGSTEERDAWMAVLEQRTLVPSADPLPASTPIAIPKGCGTGFLSGSPRSPGFLNGSPRSHQKPLLSLSALSEEEEEEDEEDACAEEKEE